MEEFYIEPTKSSPEVEFKPEENELIIKGESYPENSFAFYQPIFDLIETAVSKPDEFKFIVEVNYLNTSSTKSFMNILDILEKAYKNGNNLVVIWYYDEDNEHSYELVSDFKEYLELPFDIVAK